MAARVAVASTNLMSIREASAVGTSFAEIIVGCYVRAGAAVGMGVGAVAHSWARLGERLDDGGSPRRFDAPDGRASSFATATAATACSHPGCASSVHLRRGGREPVVG